ncbi:MAG: peptide chain release factor N(5)-glutamine methyltransferase [Pseudanabaenaceae cyanobacterium]
MSDFWQWYDRALESADRYAVPRTELDWLVETVLGIDKLHLRLRDVVVKDDRGIDQLWQKRIHDRVPVQYLAGKTIWRGMELVVNPSVLIPRPETELLIDIVDNLPPAPHRLGIWVDMGTGSGAIAIALAKIMPNATIHGVDISAAALEIARLNADRQGVPIHFHQGNWYEAIPELAGQIAGIVSNPPYIPTKDIPLLEKEVRNHEPLVALDGGADGYQAILQLLYGAPQFLKSGGHLFLELMAGQAMVIQGVLKQHPRYAKVQVHRDLHLVDRFIAATVL